jgi:hypothetical protein
LQTARPAFATALAVDFRCHPEPEHHIHDGRIPAPSNWRAPTKLNSALVPDAPMLHAEMRDDGPVRWFVGDSVHSSEKRISFSWRFAS